jgi:Ser/Thr protein kinase RdoA (MazF antagonist)
MATLHESLKDLESKAPEVTSYHAVKELTTIVNRYAGTLRSRGRRACATLVEAYDESVECVEALGWSSWPTSVVHGDWHPGNVLFGEDGEVALVLDFDAVRADPRVADIAAAVLHFGRYVNSRSDHDESSWPVRVDGDAACEFLRGYIQATSIPLEGTELAAIPALMIEAVILETMPSMIRDGRFGHHDAKAFLPLVATSVERLQAESGRLIGQMRAMVR